MKKYLYLLKFNDGIHSKIGISSRNDSRIKHLHSIYNLNLKESFIITTDKSRAISSLESELLCIYDKNCDNFIGLDGCSEIRKDLDLNEIINFIKAKPKSLRYKINNYFEVFNDIKLSNKKVKDTRYNNYPKEERKLLLKWDYETLNKFYKEFFNFISFLESGNLISIKSKDKLFKIEFNDGYCKKEDLTDKLGCNLENNGLYIRIGVVSHNFNKTTLIHSVIFDFTYTYIIPSFNTEIITKLCSVKPLLEIKCN